MVGVVLEGGTVLEIGWRSDGLADGVVDDLLDGYLVVECVVDWVFDGGVGFGR